MRSTSASNCVVPRWPTKSHLPSKALASSKVAAGPHRPIKRLFFIVSSASASPATGVFVCWS